MVLDNGNKVNEDVEQNKKSGAELKSEFLKDFKNDIEGKDNSEKIAFFDKIKKFNTIDSSIKNELNKNFNYSSEETLLKEGAKKYPGLDINSISIMDLKKLFSSDIISIGNERKALKDIFLNDYEIDEKEYNSSILSEIEKSTSTKIIDLKKSPKERNEFLISILGKENLPLLKKKVNFFEKISGLKEKVLDENIENRDKLENILSRLDSRNKSSKLGSMDIGTLSDLFNLDFLEKSFKKQIIHDFLPVISFKDAKNAGIIFNENKQKEEIIKQTFSEEDINNIGLSELISRLKNDNIYLETEKLLSSEENISKISKDTLLSENIAKSFSEDFNISLDEIIEETKNNGPQTLKSLSDELGKINKEGRFNNLGKFSEGNIMEVSKKLPTGEVEISYIKILKAYDDKKELSVLEVGNENIVNITQDGEGKQISYLEFFKNFENSAIKLDFFTKRDIEEKIKNPSSDLKGSDLELFNDDDISSLDDEKKQEYKDYYKENLENGLNSLKKDLEQSNSTENEDTLLKARIKDLEEQIENVDNLDGTELLDFLNFQKLIEKIDDIDQDGKSLGLEKGLILNSEKGAVFEILGIDKENQTIDVLSRGEKGNIKKEFGITYENFFQACKEHKIKRNKKILDFNSFIELKKIDDKTWNNHEIKDGEIIAKAVEDGENTEDKKVEYLVSSDNDEIIKINNISGNQVTFQFGDRKDIGNLDEDEKKKFKGDKGEVLYLDKTEYTFSINELDTYIKKHKLHPDWKVGKEHKGEKPKDLENEIKGSFLSRYFDRISVNELLAGGKMFIESIEETMKKGNDLHAAKMALAMGSFLPDEIKAELQIKVERQESEEMDKALEGLGKVDSPIATKRIEDWLLNKDTPEYKKEAGILFMLDKYGHLTAKGPLYPYRGKFLWYEALGGRINDELFLSIQEDAVKGNITFSEEYLVHILLKKQCNGKLPPKRRSRLHKEYEAKWKNGIKEEFDKGYGDAEKKRSATDMVKGGNDEAGSGTTSNSVGWYKKAIERGGTLEEMSEGFFALLYSGALYDVDQATFLKIKGLWDAEGMPIIMTRFSSYKSDMVLFNKTVLELSKKIGEAYGDEFPKIGDAAQNLFDNAINGHGSEKDRFNETLDFWKKYGTPLSRALNFSNTSDSTYSKTDKIIFFEKENNSVFKNYYDSVRNFTTEGSFKKEFMEDACGNAGITGLNVNQLGKQYLKMDVGGAMKEGLGAANVWNEISADIKSTKNKIFVGDKVNSEENIKAQKKYLLYILKDLTASFIANHGGRPDALKSYNLPTSNIGEDLNNWDLNILNDLGSFSPKNILKENGEADNILLNSIDKILSGNIQANSIEGSSLFDEIIIGTKKQANNTVYEPNEENVA